MGYGIFSKLRTFFVPFSDASRVLRGHPALLQPCRKAGLFHNEHPGAVRLAQLGRLVGVAQEPAVIHQEPGRYRVQVLLDLQVVVVPDTAVREIPAIDMGEAHHTMPEPFDHMGFHILLQRGSERVGQILRTPGLPSLGKQTGQGDLNNAVSLLDMDVLHGGGGGQVLVLFDIGAGVDQVPQPAGNALRPQRRVSGQNLVIIRVSLDVRGVHGVEGAVQTLNIVQNRGNSLGNRASVQSGFSHSFL